MKHLLIGLGILVALLVVAALVAPSFIDWNRYKGEVARRVEEATGRPLAIEGNVALAILPTPRLSVSGVRLASLPGSASPELLRLKALEAHVAFASLLAGRIQIESLALIEPQLNLERLADGRGNWQFAPVGPASGARARGEDAGSAGNPAAAGAVPAPLPSWLQLDHVTIEGGAVSYRDAKTGRVWALGQINGGLNAGSPSGPFRAQGRALAGKLPLTLDASLERLGGKRPAGVGLRVGITGAQLDFSGSVADSKDGPEFSGKLRASSPDLSAAAISLGFAELASLPAFSQSLAFDGNLSMGGQKLVLSQLSLRLGESEASGSISYEPGSTGRAAATLSLTRVDLDKWLAAKASPGAGQAGAKDEVGKAASAAPLSFTLPDDLEATLDISLDGVLYKGGVVRQIRFGAALNKGELALTQLTAELPGGSDVTLYGALKTPKGAPVFSGNIEAASDNLRALFDWLKIDVGGVPAERLRRLSLNSALQLTPSQLQLRDVDAVLDSSHLAGAATILLQERPAFGASIAVDRLNLDAYLPQASETKPAPAEPATKEQAKPAAPAAAAIAAPEDALHLLDSFDANLRARVDELIYRGEAIHGIHLDATVQSGALTLREVSIDDLAGLKGKATASLAGPDGGRKLDASFDLSDAELADFLRLAGWRPPLPLDQLGAAALKGHVSGALDKLAIELEGGLMEGTYKLAGTVGLGAAGAFYDLDVSAKQPHLARLVRLLASEQEVGELGTLELSGHVSGDGSKIAVSGLRSQSGLITATGDISVAGFRQEDTLAANLKLETPRLGTLLTLAGVKAPTGLDGLGPAEAEVKLDGDRSGYALEGKLAASGGSLRLAGKLAATDAGPSYDLTLDAEAPELATLLQALLPDYRPTSRKLGGFQLHAKVGGDREKLDLSELQAKLGPISVSGTLAAAFAGARPKLKVLLEASAFELDPFLPAGDGERGQNRRARGQAVTGQSTRWSTKALELASLKGVDADIGLSTPELTYGQYRVEEAKLAATLDNAVLTLGELSGKLYEGNLKLTGTLDAQTEPKASLSLRLDGAKLGQAGLKLGAVKLKDGTLTTSADLATSGESELALVRGLDGKGALKMEGGVIQGLDFNAVNARLAKPGGGADLIALVQAATSGGETKITRLEGTFGVKDGVAESKDLMLEVDGASAKGEGSIDLPRWYMEYQTAFKLTAAEDAPPFLIKLKGAPDEPRKFLDSNAFQEWLVKRAASAAPKGARKGATEPAHPGDSSPDAIINNILKAP
ncbi:MAG: AsmA family protein [Alphaproteobacteria bacterium]